MREIRNFIRDAYSINNELTAPALCKKIENELGYEVKLTMLKKLRRELGFVYKSTKYSHLIRPTNKEKRIQFCTRMNHLLTAYSLMKPPSVRFEHEDLLCTERSVIS
uniref:HTH_33 domain-containing protein n=1 Tax=Heterorhabditis bacteriophora TaxID=37862 RepID=A0A1I7XCG0_HETBA